MTFAGAVTRPGRQFVKRAPRTRRLVRAWLRRMQFAVDRRTLSHDEFADGLKAIGIARGATVFIHSSMDAITRRVPGMGPVRLIGLLKELVGQEGTLLVPTFPFDGLQYDYVQRQQVFDVARTPSRVGLLTEVFRRTEGVTRSLHPTHSVAAWGARSRELLAEHHLGTAFGENSPLYKMRRYGGLVVGVGVAPERTLSIFHVSEELHPITRALQYGTESFEMTIVEADRKSRYSVVPLRPDRQRPYGRVVRILKREGTVRSHTKAGLRFTVADVDRVLDRARELIDEERFYGA